MNRKKMLYLGMIVLFGSLGIFSWNLVARAGYETAEYKVLESDGKFEVREYPDLMLVSTTTNLESQGSDGSFMPKDVAEAGVPKPTGEQVDLRKRPGGRFAVLRFAGQLSEKSSKEAESKLREWMKSKGLSAEETGERTSVETAGYDPPFTPGPLRRNEVLIRLK